MSAPRHFDISNAPTLSDMKRALEIKTKPLPECFKYAGDCDPSAIDPLKNKCLKFSIDVHDVRPRENFWLCAWWVMVGSDVVLQHTGGSDEACARLFVCGPNSKSVPPPWADKQYGSVWHVCPNDGGRRVLWKKEGGRTKDSLLWAKKWVEENGPIECPMHCSVEGCRHCCNKPSGEWQSVQTWIKRAFVLREAVTGVQIERAAAFLAFTPPKLFWVVIVEAVVLNPTFHLLVPNLRDMLAIRGVSGADIVFIAHYLAETLNIGKDLVMRTSCKENVVACVYLLVTCLELQMLTDPVDPRDPIAWQRYQKWAGVSQMKHRDSWSLSVLGIMSTFIDKTGPSERRQGTDPAVFAVLDRALYHFGLGPAGEVMLQARVKVASKLKNIEDKEQRKLEKKQREARAREQKMLASKQTAEQEVDQVVKQLMGSAIGRVLHGIAEEEEKRPALEAAQRRARIAAEERARRRAEANAPRVVPIAVDHRAPDLYPELRPQPSAEALLQRQQWAEAAPERAEERARNKEKKETFDREDKERRAKARAKAIVSAMDTREMARLAREFTAPPEAERSAQRAGDIVEAAELKAAERATAAVARMR